ncbi:hypothetical protein PSY31_23265, partial [Shigella flexneri]|nr:hypothetical protein [Shigella flexneri]
YKTIGRNKNKKKYNMSGLQDKPYLADIMDEQKRAKEEVFSGKKIDRPPIRFDTDERLNLVEEKLEWV